MIEQHFTQVPGYHHIVFSPREPYVSEKKMPLIVFLHGIGERGNDLKLVTSTGLPRILKEREMSPFLTVAPQCPEKEYWIPSMIDELIPVVAGNYKIDHDRIYLTGISMGGYGVWMTAINYPDRFAAIAPICGGGEPAMAAMIKDIPVWTFHGAKDPVVPVSETETMVNALQKVGGNVRYTKYPEGRHDVWTETYQNEELYKWFLAHNRKERAARKVS